MKICDSNYNEAAKIFGKIPKEFLSEKSMLQKYIIDYYDRFIKARKKVYDEQVARISEEIQKYLHLAEGYIKKANYELAEEVFSEIKRYFASMPEGYLHKRAEMNEKILFIYKKLIIGMDGKGLSLE